MSERVAEREPDEAAWFAPSDDGGLLPIPLTSRPFLPVPVPDPLAAKTGIKLYFQIERFERARSALRDAVTLEAERGIGFLLVPVFLAAGAFFYFALPFEPGWALVLAAVPLPVAALIMSRRHAAGAALAGVLACIVAGMLVAKLETWRAGTKVLGGEVSTRITGTVAAIEPLAGGRSRVTIDVSSTERPKLRYQPDRVRVSARRLPDGLQAGSAVSGLVRLRPPSGPVRPGSYDFSFASYFNGIGATGYFMSGPDLAAAQPKPTIWASVAQGVQNLRLTVAERVRTRIGGPEGEIAAALLVGVRAGIPQDVSEALRKSGLYHIISISGLHMALVAGAVIGVLRLAFACFPAFASRHPVRKYAASGALAAIAGYLAISGGEVAAQRSFLMLAVMLSAVLADRAALTMRNLAISAIVVIALSPHEIVGPSFQMSFAATAALVAAYALWSERRNARPAPPHQQSWLGVMVRRSGRILAGLLLTSLVAGLATAIFGAHHFQRVSPLSLAANLAAAPIVSGVIVPSALAAAVLSPIGADGPFLDIMGAGLSGMIAVARWFSDRSPVDAVGLVSGWSVVFVSLALIAATMPTTWLRLLAIPPAIMAVLLLGTARTPDVLVSEDGELVAVNSQDTAMAVDQARGNAFTIADWQRALGADSVLRPKIGPKSETTAGPEFRCDEQLCVARTQDGATIVHAKDAEAALKACGYADVLIVSHVNGPTRCADRSVLVVTQRQLARNGAAAIYLSPYAPTSAKPEIRFAIPDATRPWHSHRVFSRAARGLPDKRAENKSAGQATDKPFTTPPASD